jgi:hypothetical protein
LSEGGVSQVLKFASTVSKADLVGEVMADLDQPEFDAALLPALLDKTNHSSIADFCLWNSFSCFLESENRRLFRRVGLFGAS